MKSERKKFIKFESNIPIALLRNNSLFNHFDMVCCYTYFPPPHF